MNQAAYEYIQSLKAKKPELSDAIGKIADDYKNRLWHQVTGKLEALIDNPAFAPELVQFYTRFLETFESKLNPLAVVKMAIVVSKQHQTPEAAIEFLTKLAAKTAASKEQVGREAHVLALAELVEAKLRAGLHADAKQQLADAKQILDNSTGFESLVYAAFYRTASNFQKTKGSPAEYYKNALLYLSYANLEALSPAARQQLAFDMCLAALIGENVYNYGELLAHPILNSLNGTPGEWIVQLLKTFNAGDLPGFRTLAAKHAAQISAQADMVANQQRLSEKIMILGLMELVFKLPSDQRVVPFKVIADATGLQLAEVEHLVMKALSLKLVRGHIDEVDQSVTVSWVQPRVLGIEQIASMEQRMQQWADNVRGTLMFMEGETSELYA